MLRNISICAALVLLSTGAVNAQQQQATLQTVALPGTGLDIVLAMPKVPAATINLAMSPDAAVVGLIGGKLALAFNSQKESLRAWEALQRPGCAFELQGKDGTALPIAAYVVPSRTPRAGIRTASLAAPQPAPLMRKAEVPGSSFDIVFAMTKTPVAMDINERQDALIVYSPGSELLMADTDDVERMFKDVGLSQLPICQFEVEHKGSSPPQAVSVYIIPKN